MLIIACVDDWQWVTTLFYTHLFIIASIPCDTFWVFIFEPVYRLYFWCTAGTIAVEHRSWHSDWPLKGFKHRYTDRNVALLASLFYQSHCCFVEVVTKQCGKQQLYDSFLSTTGPWLLTTEVIHFWYRCNACWYYFQVVMLLRLLNSSPPTQLALTTAISWITGLSNLEQEIHNSLTWA